MSAKIPENMEIKDLLKATRYDCPEELQDKTFAQATSGSGGGGSEDNTPVIITQYTGRGYVSALRFEKNAEVIITSVESADFPESSLNVNIGNEQGLSLLNYQIVSAVMKVNGVEYSITAIT